MAADLPMLGVFLTRYGSLVIAAIALVQVWFIALWKRFVSRGRLDLFRAGNLEVGFGTFGPSLALIGTLRAHQRDVFVKEMQAEVRRVEDGATRLLKWRAFRPNDIPIGAPQSRTITFASGLSVRVDSPLKYNVFLSPDSFLSDYRATAQALPKRWGAFIVEAFQKVDENVRNQLASAAQNPLLTEFLFQLFLQDATAQVLREALTREFYWKPGHYDLNFRVDTASPARPVAYRWSFALDQNDLQAVESNVDTCIRELIGLAATYAFAYPAYQEPTTRQCRAS
jgi:hypothetical protein